MKKLLTIASFAGLCLAFGTANAGVTIGPKLGLYSPTSGKTRAAFGDTWLSFGFGPVQTSQANRDRFLDSDVQFLSRNKNGNRLLIISATYGPVMRLTQSNDNRAVPYVALRGGLAYMDYGIGQGAARLSKRRVGINVNAELGVNLGQSARAAVRYNAMSRFDGYNFDGFGVEISIRLARL